MTDRATTQSETRANRVTIGVLADPEAAPAEIGAAMQDELADALSERIDDDRDWQVLVRHERLPSGTPGSHREMMDLATRRRDQQGWDVVVCLTDLPMRHGRQPLVADADPHRGVGLLSLPAFGALFLRRRVRAAMVQVVALLSEGAESWRAAAAQDRKSLPGSLRWTPDDELDDDHGGAQMVAGKGRTRLLIGMVRDNRPWRLVAGLTSALAAAFAFSAFWLANAQIWELSQALSAPRLVIIAVGAVLAMVAWLILGHGLWERPSHDREPEREHAMLLNASTVLTLLIGVLVMGAALFVGNLTAGSLLVEGGVLREHAMVEPSPVAYVRLAWLATSVALVAGAVGSGFESDAAVREAVYSFRERERRAAADDDHTDVA